MKNNYDIGPIEYRRWISDLHTTRGMINFGSFFVMGDDDIDEDVEEDYFRKPFLAVWHLF